MKGTIHIFGYGETQIISEKTNFKAKTADLKKVQVVIDDIKSKKPADKAASDYHVINIFGDLRADYNAKQASDAKPKDDNKGSFSVAFKDIDSKKLDALVAEFEALAKV